MCYYCETCRKCPGPPRPPSSFFLGMLQMWGWKSQAYFSDTFNLQDMVLHLKNTLKKTRLMKNRKPFDLMVLWLIIIIWRRVPLVSAGSLPLTVPASASRCRVGSTVLSRPSIISTLGGRSRRISASSRPAWFIKQVSGQPGLQRETLSWKTNPSKQAKSNQITT